MEIAFIKTQEQTYKFRRNLLVHGFACKDQNREAYKHLKLGNLTTYCNEIMCGMNYVFYMTQRIPVIPKYFIYNGINEHIHLN